MGISQVSLNNRLVKLYKIQIPNCSCVFLLNCKYTAAELLIIFSATVKHKHSAAPPAVILTAALPTCSGWRILVFTRELECVKLWGMSAALNVRPVTRDDSQAFVVSRRFFVWKSLRFGSKRLERVGDLAALEAILDSCSQQSHGIKLLGQERSIFVASCLKSAIYWSLSYISLQITENEKQTLFCVLVKSYVSHCNPDQTRRAETDSYS